MTQGYIAITSAIVITFLIIVVASALSVSTYFARSNVLSSQTKETSLTLAEACADQALLKLKQDPSYSGNETITVEALDTCAILPITVQGNQKTIETTATVQGAASKVKVVANQSSSLSIVSWEEIP